MSGGLVGGRCYVGDVNSSEVMQAGGESVVWRMKFGEAAVVGGDDLFGCFPPAEGLLPGGEHQLR